MIRFEKQKSSEHRFVLVCDTVCEGYITDTNEDGDIVLYTIEEAEAEIQELKEAFEDDDHFILPAEEYLHNRKTFYPIGIEGEIPEKQ